MCQGNSLGCGWPIRDAVEALAMQPRPPPDHALGCPTHAGDEKRDLAFFRCGADGLAAGHICSTTTPLGNPAAPSSATVSRLPVTHSFHSI